MIYGAIRLRFILTLLAAAFIKVDLRSTPGPAAFCPAKCLRAAPKLRETPVT